MRRRNSSAESLATSLADLMTSLMVIFVLMLLVFLDHQSSAAKAKGADLRTALERALQKTGFRVETDPKDPDGVVLIAPSRLRFAEGSPDLAPDGVQFLRSAIPRLARTVCSPAFRADIGSFVVEGHTDRHWRAASTGQGKKLNNLALSQQRAMAVLQASVADLDPARQQCFLNDLAVSANGRGDEGCPENPDDAACRNVRFRIHISGERINALRARLQR